MPEITVTAGPTIGLTVETTEIEVSVPGSLTIVGDIIGGGGFDGEHNDLDGRDAADAHPASSISVAGIDGIEDQQAFDEAVVAFIGTGTAIAGQSRFVGSSATLDADNDGVIHVDASTGDLTLTLPSSGLPQGRAFLVIRVDGSANAITVASDAEINGATDDIELASRGDGVVLATTGDEWSAAIIGGGGGGGAVDSVNGQTGVVVLDAADVGADPAGTAAALVDDLSGVTDASTARLNLGLGDSATRNVGTGAGTVAAGDDSRLSDQRTPLDNSVTSAKIVDGTIVDADISASAAIALSKLATDPLARANHTGTQDASTIGSGTIATARLGSGTASSTTFLRGDQTWATPAGGGSVATDAIWDAKGDLAVGTGADAASRLAVGTGANTVIMADGSASTGLRYVPPALYKCVRAVDGGDIGWHPPDVVLSSAGASPQGSGHAQRAIWLPCFTPIRTQIRVQSYCFTAESGAVLRVATWTFNPATAKPGTLIEDLGTFSGSTTGTKTSSTSTEYVGPGWFFLATWQSNHSTVRWPAPGPSQGTAVGARIFGTSMASDRVHWGWWETSLDYSSGWSPTLPGLSMGFGTVSGALALWSWA